MMRKANIIPQDAEVENFKLAACGFHGYSGSLYRLSQITLKD